MFPTLFPADVAFVWSEGLGSAPALLPQERAVLGKAASGRRVKDFTLGRQCAREALARLAGHPPGTGATPVLRAAGRAPSWPAGVVGAITHTGGRAAAAVAAEAGYLGIGLDLERLRRGSPRLARRILRPAEQETANALGDAERDGWVTAIFSAKESIFKALNPATGVFLGFQDASVELESPPETGIGVFRWRLHRACGAKLPEGFTGEGRLACRGGHGLTAVWVKQP